MAMFLEKVRSEGLAHLSYIFGHDGQAAVVDPRRDVQVYLDIAREHGARITHIFETHRNEDYVTGSQELARITGAEIYHGPVTNFGYGTSVEEGDTFDVGALQVGVLHTPGHTPDSISLTLTDTSTGPEPVAVFTGDTLFVRDVGRTDFFQPKEKWAEMLYHSLHDKLLPLGDEVILYPAHGAGSVCGGELAPREFSTIGIERETNPMLQLGKQAFIARKAAEEHATPPYFKKMEEYNQFGTAPLMHVVPEPQAMSATAIAQAMDDGAILLDTRSPEAFAGAFIPGSLAIPMPMIPAYAGYFLDYQTDIVLVVEEPEDVERAHILLARLGYDRVRGYLAGGLHSWVVEGRDYDRVPAVHVDELTRRIVAGEDFVLLDVRTDLEVEVEGKLQGATHIPLSELPARLGEVPRDKPVTTFCGSGRRAIIAASILKQHGFEDVEVNFGSMAACKVRGCPMETEAD